MEMTKSQPNGRILAVLVLKKVITDHCALDSAFAHYLKEASSQEASLIYELSYGVLRWYYKLQDIANSLLVKPLGRHDLITQVLLLVGLYQLGFMRLPAYAAINETVKAAKRLKKTWLVTILNGVLRRFARAPEKFSTVNADNLVAYYAHPQWLIELLQQNYPRQWRDILDANNQRAPMHLCINSRVTTRPNYLALLAQKHLVATPHAQVATCITLNAACDVQALPDFALGAIAVQDAAAQLAAELLELKPQQRVLDACAAPGNKTANILELEPELQEVIAVDISATRLQKIRENLTRLNLTATLIKGDATQPTKWWDKKLFDRILLDAPCTASGVIRRHPEIKILRTPQDLTHAIKLQRELLEALWPLLVPNGILLYATCSVFTAENEENIAWFISQQTDAYVLPITASWGHAQKYGRQIFPGEHAMDWFYYAKVKKR